MGFLLLLAIPIMRVLRPFGAIGLAALGVISSLVPLPGSTEALTIILAARHRELWWYYGLAATLGAVIGGYIPYRVGVTGGKQLLARRFSPRQAEKWTERLHDWGFGAVVLSGLLPPPLPATPVLLAAGAARYPRNRYIAALTLGRGARFLLLGSLAAIYGRRAVRVMNRFMWPMIVVAVIGAVAYAAFLWYERRIQELDALSNAYPAPESSETDPDCVSNSVHENAIA